MAIKRKIPNHVSSQQMTMSSLDDEDDSGITNINDREDEQCILK